MVLLTPTLHGHDGLSCLSRQLRAALATLAGEDVPVLHLENGSPRFAKDVLMAAVRKPDVAVVAHLHLMPAVWPLLWGGTRVVPVLVGIEAWEPMQPARERAMRRVDRAIAISHYTEQEFKRANAAFAHLPVDVCWPAAPALPEAATASSNAQPFALIVGRMSAEERYKGHDELIDVWPYVRNHVPQARLVVAGGGDDLERLRERVTTGGLGDAITFEEQVSEVRLAELYRDCAFLVLPSRREGFGYVLLEAMRAGRACIGGQGAAEEIIEEGTTGLIVDPASPDQMVRAIVTLFQNPARRTQMGIAGRQRVNEVFSIERFTRDLRGALARC
jgi:phosphatidylinositol alpha-1,6-mannosyltransferase